jgi:hypothetical protein
LSPGYRLSRKVGASHYILRQAELKTTTYDEDFGACTKLRESRLPANVHTSRRQGPQSMHDDAECLGDL